MIRALALVALVVAGCGGPSDCNPSNCSGCCSSRDTCVEGASATECGSGGGSCSTCGAKSECAERACRVKCVCQQGCCGADGGCITKQGTEEVFSNASCPNNGNTYCTPCEASKTCKAYATMPTATIYLCQ